MEVVVHGYSTSVKINKEDPRALALLCEKIKLPRYIFSMYV